MDKLLRDIMGVMGEDKVSLNIYDGTVWFELFDDVVIVEFEDDQVVVQSFNRRLDSHKLITLYTVLDLINKNIHVIKNII